MAGEQQGGQTAEGWLMSDEQYRTIALFVICEPFGSSEDFTDIGGGANTWICDEGECQRMRRLLASNSLADENVQVFRLLFMQPACDMTRLLFSVRGKRALQIRQADGRFLRLGMTSENQFYWSVFVGNMRYFIVGILREYNFRRDATA